jgi:hypothetical protein
MSECAALRRDKEPWSDNDIETLADLYFVDPKKRSYDAMVEALGRTKSAIQSEISRRGMAQPGARMRACIGAECYGRRKFFSASAGHRICQRCSVTEIYRCAS